MKGYKRIDIPHLPIVVKFCISKKPLEMRNSLIKDYDLPEFPDDDFTGLHTYDKNGNFWLTFKKGCSAGTIAHESFHLIGRIFEHLDMHYDVDSDEHFAYMLSYIVDEIVKEIK